MTSITEQQVTATTAEKKAAAAEKRAAAQAALAAHAWIGPANAAFIAGAAARHHKGKFVVSPTDGGYTIKPSTDGLAFFTARKAASKMTAEHFAAVAAAKANKAGRYADRNFVSNAARIKGKPVALPTFAGSGDALQQYLFSALIINEI